MKSKFLKAAGFVLVVLAVAFTTADLIRFTARANDRVLPPSNHTADSGNVAHKSNAEDFSGQNSAQGRFWLFQGTSLISAGGDSTTMPAILRIDSQTGRTWLLVITTATGTTNFGFVELPDLKHE